MALTMDDTTSQHQKNRVPVPKHQASSDQQAKQQQPQLGVGVVASSGNGEDSHHARLIPGTVRADATIPPIIPSPSTHSQPPQDLRGPSASGISKSKTSAMVRTQVGGDVGSESTTRLLQQQPSEVSSVGAGVSSVGAKTVPGSSTAETSDSTAPAQPRSVPLPVESSPLSSAPLSSSASLAPLNAFPPSLSRPAATTTTAHSKQAETATATAVAPAAPRPQQPNKKRRLQAQPATSKKPLPTPLSPESLPHLPDQLAIVQTTVQQIVNLLNTYGPLTAGQLEYNLPPPSAQAIALSRSYIHDILELLVTLGMVQQVVPETAVTGPSYDPETAQFLLEATAVPPNISTDIRYCVNQGAPRGDSTFWLPPQLLEQLNAAVNETARAQERAARLAQLFSSTSNAATTASSKKRSNHKEVLRQIMADYPEVLHDPVYVTALKNLHVDMEGGGGGPPPAKRERKASPQTKTTTFATPVSTPTTTYSPETAEAARAAVAAVIQQTATTAVTVPQTAPSASVKPKAAKRSASVAAEKSAPAQSNQEPPATNNNDSILESSQNGTEQHPQADSSGDTGPAPERR